LFDNNLRPNGEEVKAKNRKTADARVRARVVSFFTAVGRYPIGTRNTGSTKRAHKPVRDTPVSPVATTRNSTAFGNKNSSNE